MKKYAHLALLIFVFAFFISKTSVSRVSAVYTDKDGVKWQYTVLKKNYNLENLFGEYWIDVLKFNRIDRNHLWPGAKLKVPLNLVGIKDYTPMPKFYPPAESYGKYVLISLKDQFLGCYEYGNLKQSFPIASGKPGHGTPVGNFKILAHHRDHRSSRYTIENTNVPYPMTWAIKFYISKKRIAYWIHGRDMPGYPASHGCVGLYDEEMQKKYYGAPKNPVLIDAKKFYLWLFPGAEFIGKEVMAQNPKIPLRIISSF